MSKYIQPWYPLLFCSACEPTEPTWRAGMERITTSEPRELAHLSEEPQSRSEAEDLLRLQDYVDKLSYTQRVLEETCNLLQRTEPLTCIISDQDLRTLRTACQCLHSLRIRVEARANMTERVVMNQQLQFMQTRVQPYPTEDLRTDDTSCPSRTSAEHFN